MLTFRGLIILISSTWKANSLRDPRELVVAARLVATRFLLLLLLSIMLGGPDAIMVLEMRGVIDRENGHRPA